MTDRVEKPRRLPWVFIGLLLLALAVSLALNAGLAAGLLLDGRGGKGKGGEDEFPQMTETWSHGGGDAKVIRIAVDGIIMRGLSGGGLFGGGEDMVESVLRQIRAATNDEDVQGILLEVDSPGGGVTPSDEIYDALKRFRASDPGRRIVVFVRDMAASGGYYVSMASDRIVAEPTAIIGSIGVIMESVNWNVLTQKIGVDATTIKAGENKDLLNPFRPVDPDHVRILQEMIDQIHGRFRSIVAEGRKMDAATVRGLADGSIFTADAAKEKGLIDEIGYWDEAVATMTAQLGVKDVRVIRYESGGSLFDRLLGVRVPGILGRLARMDGPRPMFLWRP
jgi:protease-4